MLKQGLFAVVFLFMALLGQTQNYEYTFSKNCQKAYKQLINLQLDSAQILIQKEKRQNPNNLIPELLSNYKDFLRLVLTEDKALFEQLKDQKKDRINQWEKGPKTSPWYLSGQAQIKLQWAFARVLFDEYFTAATEINSAYHLLEENKILYPNFYADNMGIGILHAMIGVIPDQYQWALELFGFYGSIEQGVEEMQEQLLHDNSNPFILESLFYYTFIRLNLQTDSTRFQELLSKYDEAPFAEMTISSPLLHFSKAVVLLKLDNEKAIEFLKQSPASPTALKFYYPDFLLGQALVYKLDPKAEKYLNNYILDYSGNNYKKTALQRLAWLKMTQNDTLGYLENMKKIQKIGNDILDSDKAAVKESEKAEDGWIPNIYLLRSRLQFDGHYYKGALDELDQLELSKSTAEVQLEYYYRKGRILHEMNRLSDAKKSYQKAIDLGKESDRYFAANSALKLGEIFENSDDFQQAAYYYKLCLDLDFSEYQKGIRAKAKAGLQRVDKR